MTKMWLLTFATMAAAIQVNLQSTDNVKSVASTIAYDMMTTYVGNQSGQVPGLLPGSLACNPNAPGVYCWWEAGAMFGSLINYWQYTGDSSYNQAISQAMLFQRGPDSNFNPPNQSRSMGVDDQDFWAFTALDAVEANFPEAGGSNPSWLSLAQATYNFQKGLWDNATCGGGFRWQVVPVNAGYNLKNTVSNGGNFMLAARLAYVTGDSQYADWADMVYDWVEQSKLFQMDKNSGTLYIWDNTDTNNGCIDQTNYVWTYNYGLMLGGSAYMYNYTNGSQIWLDRVHLILNSTYSLFFPTVNGAPGNVMKEILCEDKLNCNQDQQSFKAYLSRWMATTALLVPSTAASILPKLTGSAQAAAQQCSGGSSGRQCGMRWTQSTWDGSPYNVGLQMAALSVIGATLNSESLVPLSTDTGATSASNPDAGADASRDPAADRTPVTTGDRVGAIIVTVVIVVIFVGGALWIVF